MMRKKEKKEQKENEKKKKKKKKTAFSCSKFQWDIKEFLQNLKKIRTCPLKKIYQP
jgi:hypothetical protein